MQAKRSLNFFFQKKRKHDVEEEEEEPDPPAPSPTVSTLVSDDGYMLIAQRFVTFCAALDAVKESYVRRVPYKQPPNGLSR